MKEDKIPVDAKGRPDLSYYTDSPEYYFAMIEQYLGTFSGKTGAGYEPDLAFRRQVHGEWGLIAHGRAAIPFALRLLGNPQAEAKACGASILAEVGGQPGVVEALLAALPTAESDEARDSIVTTLGAMRSRKAIPALGALIRSKEADRDTRWTAAESLGRIVRRRFDKSSDPIEAALAWLTSHKV
jgi:HEAT repeat protein